MTAPPRPVPRGSRPSAASAPPDSPSAATASPAASQPPVPPDSPTPPTLACIATPEDAGERADVVLGRRVPGLSRRVARELGLAGRLTIEGRRAPPSQRVRPGDHLSLQTPTAPLTAPLTPQLLAVTPRLVYVDKPPGLHTHRLSPADPPALADWLSERFPECRGASPDPREAGALHRLDHGTSGVVAFARDPDTWAAARAAFADRRVRKRYAALTTCPPDHLWPPPAGPWLARDADAVEISAPLGHGDARGRVAVRPDGQPALTRVAPAGPPGPRRLWQLDLVTGRRHQARVHLAWLGLPIVGDARYGGAPADRLCLHAWTLDLSAALPGEAPVTAPLPPALRDRSP